MTFFMHWGGWSLFVVSLVVIIAFQVQLWIRQSVMLDSVLEVSRQQHEALLDIGNAAMDALDGPFHNQNDALVDIAKRALATLPERRERC